MGEVSSLRVGRFMRLPRRSDERWQGGLVRLPSWVDEPDGPFRPWAAVWVSRRTGLAHHRLDCHSPRTASHVAGSGAGDHLGRGNDRALQPRSMSVRGV